MTDPYYGREQTKAKHFILRHYLQELAFKVLSFSDVAYVDGFSGPWETKTETFEDSSFMIAISVLRDAQEQYAQKTGKRPRIRCFFSEIDAEAYAQLERAVAPFHKPDEGFEIQTYHGQFADAVSEIQAFVGSSFALVFIDPTGWKGYPFDKIKSLFKPRLCEVLINFMYDFVNRFASSEDPDIIRSLEPILGGPDWRDRLDPSLPRGLALEKLFRETLKSAGNFKFVVSTKIDKATADRPHFFITYGTKVGAGLKAFRETEYAALRAYEQNRAEARERKREQRTGQLSLLAGLLPCETAEMTVDEIVAEQKEKASQFLMKTLKPGRVKFSHVADRLLEAYMLRETNVKDICVDLAKAGKIENTWGGGRRKPHDDDLITPKVF